MSQAYRAAEAYLLGTIDETVSRREPYRLERMRALLRELGDPQPAYPTVHVGGTSGKGSTSSMIAAALQAFGSRVGLHTKPHLVSMTERARVDGTAIGEDAFAQTLERMMPAIERAGRVHGRPSYYETLLALAFQHFKDERVDVAAIEVGLGGRLDGTNVILPDVAAITSIGFDHTDVLGDTLEAIAREKAGIAKPSVPLVHAVEDEGARQCIEAIAISVGAPIVRVAEVASVGAASVRPGSQSFTVTTDRGEYRIALPVQGAFQRRNAATAIAVLERLRPSLRPSIEAVERGLAALSMPGRMEAFAGSPTVIFDIAHNAEKAAGLADSLRESYPGQRVRYVVAIGESKNAEAILRALDARSTSFWFAPFEAAGRPSVPPERLAAMATALGLEARAFGDAREALTNALRDCAPQDLVVVTGSTFVVATLRAWWMERADECAARV